MEREIANVAASCAMRGFRYMAFPPIAFELPLPVAPPAWQMPLPEPARAPAPVPEANRPDLAESAAGRDKDGERVWQRANEPDGPSVVAPVAAPAMASPAWSATAAPAPPPVASPPLRKPRFALLTEVSAQLHRQARP